MNFTQAQQAAMKAVADNFGLPEVVSNPGTFYDESSGLIISPHLSDNFQTLPQVGVYNRSECTTEESPTDGIAGSMVVKIRRAVEQAFKELPKEKSNAEKKKFIPKVEHDSAKQGQNYTAPKPPLGKVRNLHQMVEGTTVCVHCGKPFDEWKDKTMDECTRVKDAPTTETKTETKIPEKQEVNNAKTHKEFMDDVNNIAINVGMIAKEVKHDESKAEEAQAVSPPAPKPPEPEPKKTVPVKNCRVCGIELVHNQAMDCYLAETGFICVECEEKKAEPKEAQIMPPEPKQMSRQPPKEPEKQPELKPTENILEYIRTYVNNDVLEIFGDSGTGKSKFAVEVARQTIAAGKTVFYLDTERNLSKEEVEKLKGCQYKYTPLISEISSLTRTLPKVDLVIIDSIGFPILTAYARMNMKQKGDALLNMIAIFGDLKEWAYRNNSIAIVINQPESDFNKEPGHLIRPFGDKSQFAAKEIWKTDVTQRGQITKSTIQAFRSRSVGHKTLIASMEVSNNGTIIKGAKI